MLDERLSLAELEKTMLAATNEAVRRVLEADLQQRSDSLPDRVSVYGAKYRRHLEGGVPARSLMQPPGGSFLQGHAATAFAA